MRQFLGVFVAVTGLAISGLILWKAPPADAPAAALVVPAAYKAGQDAAAPAAPLAAPTAPISDADREARRFSRYDKDSSAAVSRAEYLVNRRKAWEKADTNNDGRLDFEEFAAASARKFGQADRNGDGALNAKEFAATAVKRKARPACVCPVAAEEE